MPERDACRLVEKVAPASGPRWRSAEVIKSISRKPPAWLAASIIPVIPHMPEGLLYSALRRGSRNLSGGYDLKPTAHQKGAASEKRMFAKPAPRIIASISTLLKRCSSGVPNRSRQSVRIV